MLYTTNRCCCCVAILCSTTMMMMMMNDDLVWWPTTTNSPYLTLPTTTSQPARHYSARLPQHLSRKSLIIIKASTGRGSFIFVRQPPTFKHRALSSVCEKSELPRKGLLPNQHTTGLCAIRGLNLHLSSGNKSSSSSSPSTCCSL